MRNLYHRDRYTISSLHHMQFQRNCPTAPVGTCFTPDLPLCEQCNSVWLSRGWCCGFCRFRCEHAKANWFDRGWTCYQCLSRAKSFNTVVRIKTSISGDEFYVKVTNRRPLWLIDLCITDATRSLKACGIHI